jgi:phage portal protein BeeE
MNLLQRILGRGSQRFNLPEQYDPLSYLYGGTQRPINGEFEVSGANLDEIAQRIFKSSGPVFALMAVRMLLFAEARYAFQRMRDGRPSDMFSTSDLAILEHPHGPSSHFRSLASRAIQDVDLMGNAYLARLDSNPDQIRRLRPDWVTAVFASSSDDDMFGDAIDAELVAYVYTPRMPNAVNADSSLGTVLLPHEVAHWAPIPDPQGYHRGMSWITPVIREISADEQALIHKEAFFRNGATPRLAMKIDPSIEPADFERLAATIEAHHVGAANAHKVLYLGGGADPVPMTVNLRDLDYKAVTGGGETRLAAAAGIHPVIVGFSEGLAGSSLNAGNYQQVKRRVGDGTLRPLWGSFAGALETIVPAPSDARLWYDERDIAFLRDDSNDAAAINEKRANTIRTLTDGGFEPVSAANAVQSGDFSQLKHTGLYSVQLQPLAAGTMPADESGNTDRPAAPPATTAPGTDAPAAQEDGTKA